MDPGAKAPGFLLPVCAAPSAVPAAARPRLIALIMPRRARGPSP